jgi:hypothetical protein
MNTDCFACTGRGCRALEKCLCANDIPCPFYKTKERVEEERLKTAKRLQRFPREAVLYIMGKYHIPSKELAYDGRRKDAIGVSTR